MPADRVALGACALLGAGLLIAGLQYPLTVDGRVGPGAYPVTVAALLLVASAVSLVRPRGAAPATDGDVVVDATWRIPAVIVLLVAYLAVVQRLGHMIASCLLAWAFLSIVGGRPWWQRILIALAIGIGAAELFARLGVPLPLGELLS